MGMDGQLIVSDATVSSCLSQVLPCLCEVMCLYDAELIMLVWGYITEEASLLSFLGLCALHRSLALCARVVATADLTDKVRGRVPSASYSKEALVQSS